MELVPHEPKSAGNVAREIDASRVGVDPDDLATRMGLAEVGREQAEPTADVENSTFVREQKVHDAEELRPEDREANVRVGALDRR